MVLATPSEYIAAPLERDSSFLLTKPFKAAVWDASGERICECYSFEDAKLIEQALNNLAARQLRQ